MKIVRRNNNMSPWSMVTLWVIPTLSYLLQKVIGVEHNKYEYLWWICISATFTFWFVLNFKIKK